MKKYICFRIRKEREDTEKELNKLSKKGYKLICSYARNNEYLIMEFGEKQK